MFKKTLISLAVASSVTLTGCIGTESGDDEKSTNSSGNASQTGVTWPIFDPGAGALPIPNDLIFDSEQGDGTFGVADTSPPVTTALNELSGASTVAPTVIQLNGQVAPASVIYGSTVFLLELDYGSGDPVQGLGNQEPPTITGSAAATAEVVTLDGLSAIRIVPTQPLKPRTRYLAVVTKNVTDLNGDPIDQSPVYKFLTDTSNSIPTALAPVAALINRIWEPLFTAATTLPASDVAISYSFTTSNDEKVLQYIAEPSSWFSDQLTTFLKVSAAKQVTGGAQFASGADLSVEDWDLNEDGVVNGDDFDFNGDTTFDSSDFDLNSDTEFTFADTSLAATAAVSAFPTPAIEAALNPIFAAAPPAGCDTLTGQTAIDCVGVALANTPSSSGGFADLLPTPSAQTVNLDVANTNDVALVSAPVSSAAGGAGNVNLVQGTIELPYYLGTPSGTNGSPLVTSYWTADSTLAGALNSAFSPLGLEIPQADASVTTAVNYIFPFPDGEVEEAPVLVMYPSSGDVSDGTILYQHGITTDRSATLSFGSALVSTLASLGQNYAVVAIDQPLHGVTPFSADSQQTLAGQLLDAAAGLTNDQATRDALIAGQVSVGALQSIDAACAAINVDFGDPASIQAGIDTVLGGGCEGDVPGSTAQLGGIVSLENTVAAAGSTIPGIANSGIERHFDFFANDSFQPVPMNFDTSATAGEDESGSLFINLTNLLTSRDNNRQGSVDLMNVRASLGNFDLNGGAAGGTLNTTNVFFVGHSLGTINGSPFVAAVNQNAMNLGNAPVAPKTTDDIVGASLLTPGGGIVRLLENSPSFAPAILAGLSGAAGLEQGDANLETYFNVLQAALDTVDPINFSDNHIAAGTGILLSQVNGDTVIPNSAGVGETLGDAFIAPLAGTEPLATTLSANDVTAASAGGAVALPAIARYTAGTHGTPVSADNPAVFAEMLGQTIQMIVSGGAQTEATDGSVIE